MPKLGEEITRRSAAPSAASTTSTNTAFLVGFTDEGAANTAVKCESIADYEEVCGKRSTTNLLFDDVDVFLREQGEVVYVSREVGPSAAAASVKLKDEEAKETVEVSAKDPGAYANGWKVKITESASKVTVEVQNAAGEKLESHGPFTRTELLAASFTYVKLTSIGSSTKLPEKGTFELTEGDDKRGSATETTLEEALAAFDSVEDAGQVAVPGNEEAHKAILAHCAANNRVGCLYLADGDEAEVLAAAETARELADAEYGGAFVGKVKCPGVTPGTVREVTADVIACALSARADANGSPNVAPCGLDFPLLYSVSATEFSQAEREALFNAGANTFLSQYGVLSLYGWQALPAEATSTITDQFNHARTLMAITAKGKRVGAEVRFKDITSTLLTAYNKKLSEALQELYNANALYGEHATEAYRVVTDSSVNTPTRIENRKS